MRAYRVLSAVVIAAMLLAVPAIANIDVSDASVDEKTSAVYFESNKDVNPTDINKFIGIDVSSGSIETILKASGDFNFGDNGFYIYNIKTSDYHVEAGKASHISDSEQQYDEFEIVEMNIEFRLKAKIDSSQLFLGTFGGDAQYGFTKSFIVQKGAEMIFKGTLRTEYSVSEKNIMSSSGDRYAVQENERKYSESTELNLTAEWAGTDQEIVFSTSFSGYGHHKAVNHFDLNTKELVFGDPYRADIVDDVYGKGELTMGYESKKYSSESKTGLFETVYGGIRSTSYYSGLESCKVDSSVLMTKAEYASMYSPVEPKTLFDNFKGTNQELGDQIGSVGSMTVDDPCIVEERADAVFSGVKGAGDSDTSREISNAVIAALIGIIVILIAALVLVNRKKNRF